MAWSRRRAAWLRIPSCRQIGFGSPGAAYPPPLIQKRFISDISHVETQTLNLILDPPHGHGARAPRPAGGGPARPLSLAALPAPPAGAGG